MTKRGEMIGSWGCMACRRTVPNNHTGPCVFCGGRISRIVPGGLEHELGFYIVAPAPRPFPVQHAAPKDVCNLLALVAAAVLCIGSPLLGASHADWNAASLVMALNVWSSSVGYYALARVRASADADAGAPVHA